MRAKDRQVYVDGVKKLGLNAYAHTSNEKIGHQTSESKWETMEEHLDQVARRCFKFASVLGLEKIGYMLGRIHDLGKFDVRFYQRIKGIILSYDHAALGALISENPAFGVFVQIILGHHGFLPDNIEKDENGQTSQGVAVRLKNALAFKCDPSALPSEADMKSCCDLFKDTCEKALEKSFYDKDTQDRFKTHFIFALEKFLYSCLVDADYLGTENFHKSKERVKRYDTLPVLKDKFDKAYAKMVGKKKNVAQQWLVDMRNDIYASAIACGNMDGTAFTLTGPTGSGKTMAYVGLALNKAIRDKKDRIFIVLPFCSIISQVCADLRKMVGDKNVIEHSSGYDLDEQVKKSGRYKQYAGRKPGYKKMKSMRGNIERLVRESFENWDAPIIVTTREQFDETFFCRYPARSRRIHNMANSVIIFDEVQTTPRSLTIPFVGELHALRDLFNSVLVLSTATQPSYGWTPERTWGLKDVVEVVPKYREYFAKAANRIVMKPLGELTIEDVAGKISKHKQVICVLNTRQNAHYVSRVLTSMNIPHLYMSTLLNKKRVMGIIREVRRRLKNGERVILVTTQIVEAGVDFDFPVGYSEECPTDSRLQRAGRVNRNGNILTPCDFFLFTLKNGNKNGGYQLANSITEAALYATGDYGLTDINTVDKYYDGYLKENGNNLDAKDIVPKSIDKRPFERVWSTDKKTKVLRLKFSKFDEFKYIANRMSICIPVDRRCEQAMDEIQQRLSNGKRPGRRLVGIAQEYMVSIYENEFDELIQVADLEESCGFHILRDMSWYDKKMGLDVWRLDCHNT